VCGSEIAHHLVHLVCIDGDAIPCHAVASLGKVATDLPVSHAAHELIPRGFVIRAELDTRLSGVVEELIVLHPQGSIPGLVSCPTVEGAEGRSGHDLGSFGMCKFYRQCRSVAVADVPVGGLVGLDLACPDCLPVFMLCLHLTLVLLHDGQHQRGGVLVVDKESCSGRCFVFHAVSMAEMGAEIKR